MQGTVGTQGTIGSQGTQGTQGTIGSQGTQGLQGTTIPSITVVGSDTTVSGNLKTTTVTEGVVVIGNSGTSKTLLLDNGTVQTCTLTGNCTFTMPSLVAGKSFLLFLNTGAGSFSSTFTSVKWSGSAPTVTTAASKVDIFTFVSDGTYWYGVYTQNY